MAFSTIMDSNSYTGAGDLDPATDTMVERRRSTLGPSYRLFYNRPVHLVKGSGAHLFDADGNDYLDVYNNVASGGARQPQGDRGAIAEQIVDAEHAHADTCTSDILDYSEATAGDDLPNEIDLDNVHSAPDRRPTTWPVRVA